MKVLCAADDDRCEFFAHLVRDLEPDAEIWYLSPDAVTDDTDFAVDVLTQGFDLVVMTLTLPRFASLRLAQAAHLFSDKVRTWLCLFSGTQASEEAVLALFDLWLGPGRGRGVRAQFEALLARVRSDELPPRLSPDGGLAPAVARLLVEASCLIRHLPGLLEEGQHPLEAFLNAPPLPVTPGRALLVRESPDLGVRNLANFLESWHREDTIGRAVSWDSLSPDLQAQVRQLMARGEPAQAVANCLEYNQVLPPEDRLPAVLSAIRQTERGYWVLAGVLGLQHLAGQRDNRSEADRLAGRDALLSVMNRRPDIIPLRVTNAISGWLTEADAPLLLPHLAHRLPDVRKNMLAVVYRLLGRTRTLELVDDLPPQFQAEHVVALAQAPERHDQAEGFDPHVPRTLLFAIPSMPAFEEKYGVDGLG